MAGNERGKAPLITSVAPPPPTPLPNPPQASPRTTVAKTPATVPAGASAAGGTRSTIAAATPTAPQDSRKAPPVSRKGQGAKKGKGPATATKPSMAEAAPTAVASSSTMASLPAAPSTSSASVPPLAPRAYARVVAAPPPPPAPAASSSRPPTASATINSGRGPFPTMTRKHGVCCLLVPTSPHVETYVQALARVVGPTAIVVASKMYGKVVFFLASEAAAQETVEKGLAVGGGVCPPGAARRPGRLPSPDLCPSFFTQRRPVTRSLHPGETHFCHQPSPVGLQGPHPPSRPFVPPASAASTAAGGA
ncbi:unnamed protein product [Caretta caretta]